MVNRKKSTKLAVRKNSVDPWKALEDIDNVLNPF